MPRRATEERSAGGVVYRLRDGVPLVLVIRDSYRNWGFPKGHIEEGEDPESAALREVREETGIGRLAIRAPIETIDWYFRFRGRLIHKTCHFFLMETPETGTMPQRDEGITACRWLPIARAEKLISYENARVVLRSARNLIPAAGSPAPEP